MEKPLAGQVAIITGASSGIGAATARALASSGAAVVLAARRGDRLEAVAAAILDAGGVAEPVTCDVRSRDEVARLATTARERFGRIDILINNAGIMPVSPIAAARMDDWDAMIDINIKGALYVIGHVLPVMLEQRAGHIVNVSSIAGRFIFPGNVVYCATKHALHVISEGLRLELAQHDPPQDRIRTTIIAPGVVDTELPASSTDAAQRERMRTYYQSIPNPLTSEDVAAAIYYAVTAAAHINVNEIVVRPVRQVR